MSKILKVRSVNDYGSYLGCPARHPLVCVIDYAEVSPIRHSLNNYGVYALFLRDDVGVELDYGCGRYDYNQRTLLCVAPGQVGGKEDNGERVSITGWALLFHSDLLRGTPLEKRIRDYSFFDYRVNEALHDKSIAGIADEILRRGARVVMIFGPSSSGKTTFANRLAVHLRVLGQRPHLVSLDDFYRDRRDIPLEPDGKPDLEHVDALDVPLLTACLEELLSGRTVQMPRFDFKTGARCPKSYELTVGPGEPLLLEGIHGMNDRITAEVPEQLTYGIYVSALSCINLDDHNRIRTTDVRLLRRIVRDMRFRNTSPAETIDMWPKVRAGEERWIFPNMEKADVMFNTSLHYELPVLKTIAYELLLSIPRTAPEYLVAHRLLKVLHYFLPVDGDVMDEIPPLSILREFIGECSFYDMH